MNKAMKQIRREHGVPAKIGEPVLFNGTPGVVTGATPGRVVVRIDGKDESFLPYHLEWPNKNDS